MADSSIGGVHPAATVVVLRECRPNDGFEVLLLRKSENLASYGGAWVFPGGRIEPNDYPTPEDEASAARRAAVRETREEADLSIEETALIPFSRWTTPKGRARRFRSWFFLAEAPLGAVSIDHGEIQAHWWTTPEDALAAHREKSIELPPPMFVTLLGLAAFSSVRALLDEPRPYPPAEYLPRTFEVPGGRCSLYQGDEAYERASPEALATPGPRHRLWMLDAGWRYERG